MICIPKVQLLFCMGDNGAFCLTTALFLSAKYKQNKKSPKSPQKHTDLEDGTGIHFTLFNSYEVGAIVIPILQIKKLRHLTRVTC